MGLGSREPASQAGAGSEEGRGSVLPAQHWAQASGHRGGHPEEHRLHPRFRGRGRSGRGFIPQEQRVPGSPRCSRRFQMFQMKKTFP